MLIRSSSDLYLTSIHHKPARSLHLQKANKDVQNAINLADENLVGNYDSPSYICRRIVLKSIMEAENVLRLLDLPQKWGAKRMRSANGWHEDLEAGYLLVSEFEVPFCLILEADEGSTEEQERVLRSYLLEYDCFTIGVLIQNENSTIAFRKNLTTGKVEKSGKLFSNVKLLEPKIVETKLFRKATVTDLVPIAPNSQNIEGLIFQLHSIIRDTDGLHADTALDEICKIVYVKLFDEEATLNGEPFKLQKDRYLSSEECASVVRSLYLEANEYDTRVFSLRIPGYKRSRGVFDSKIILSTSAISQIIEAIQGISFSNTDTDLKGRIFQNLISPVLRSGFGQYFTPNEVVSLIVKLIEPQIRDLIIDPFAGSGHFLSSTIGYVKNSNPNCSLKIFDEFLFNKLHGIEISERMVRISMTDMRLHGDGHSNIRCSDSLLDFSSYQDLQEGTFDIVMTNPPFGSLISSGALHNYSHFRLIRGRKSIPLEVLGIERSVELLRPNGKLAIVVPDSILVNSNLRFVRNWLCEKLNIVALISLPVETFSPFGANIKTSIIIARKKTNRGNVGKSDVFIADIENIGYDAAGRERNSNDICQVVDAFREYLSNHKIDWR